MIDIKLIRENPDLVKKAARDKRMTVDIDRVLAVDEKRRELETEFNNLRHEQKQAGEKIAQAPKDEKAALSKAMGALKGKLKAIEEQRAAVDAELGELLLLLPQVPTSGRPDRAGRVRQHRGAQGRPTEDQGPARLRIQGPRRSRRGTRAVRFRTRREARRQPQTTSSPASARCCTRRCSAWRGK